MNNESNTNDTQDEITDAEAIRASLQSDRDYCYDSDISIEDAAR